MLSRTLIALSLVTLLTATVACKSELDNKPSAKVEEPAKAEEKAPPAAEQKAAPAPEKKAEPAVEEKAEPAASPAADSEHLHCDTDQSSIGFVGAKVTGDHEGAFTEFTGKATLVAGQASAVSFTVQTASVVADAEKLTKHLNSPDFFDVARFPTAIFHSKAIKAGGEGGATHTISGDLTLHGVTKTITFPATVKVGDGGASGQAEFKINRKDFAIVYPGMPDDLIKDEVLLKLNLVFSP